MRIFSRKAIIILLILFIFVTIECYAWTWPITGSSTHGLFTSEYGPNNAGSPWYRFHYGLDIDADTGDNVYAAHNGVVEDIYYHSAYGKTVLIRSNDYSYKTVFSHLSDNQIVSINDPINEGQVIGLAGSTGQSTGPHLHFEYRDENDNKLHPLQVMPYDDCYLLGCELVDNSDINFTIQLTIATNELDIDSLVFYIYYTDGVWDYDGILSVDYSEKQNIPLINNDNDIIVLDNHWVMTVTPEYWDPGSAYDYTITFNFQPNQSGVRAYTVEADIYAANGWWDGDLDLEFLVPSPVEELNSDILATSLYNNYPNPFSSTSTISYSLAHKIKNPKIEIYNIKGQKVKTFMLEEKKGENSFIWDGRDETGKYVFSGIYFQKLVNNSKVIDVKKILLIR